MASSRFLCCLAVLLAWSCRALFAADPVDTSKGEAVFNLSKEQVANLEAKTQKGDYGACLQLSDYLTLEKEDPVAAAHWWKVLVDQGNVEAIVEVGVSLMYARDFDTAEKWMNRAKENGDDFADSCLKDLANRRTKPASRYWKAPDPKSLAEFSLTPAPSPDDPKDAAGYIARAAARLAKEDSPGAMADTDRALEIDPKSARAFFMRAQVKEFEGNLNGAVTDYTRTIELDPKNVEAYTKRGFAKGTLGDQDGLFVDADRAVELDPKNAQAWCFRGMAQLAKGRLQEAIADEKQAIALAPKYAAAHDELGCAYEGTGQWRDAQVAYSHAVDLAPKYANYYYDRAGVEMLQEDWPAALADYRQVCALQDLGSRQGYAQICIWQIRCRMNETDAANKDLAAYLDGRRDKTRPEWISWVGDFLLGKTDETTFLKSPSGRAVGLDSIEAYYYAGLKKLLSGDKSGAKDYFQKSVDMDTPAFTEFHLAKQALQALEH